MSSDSAGLIYPVQCLTFTKNHVIASAGPELYVYVIPDLLDESISLKRPASRSENRGAISHVAVDHDAKHLVTIGIEDKSLIVWDLSHLSLLSSREIPKRATNIVMTRSPTTILVSDKFGDVFRYPLQFDPDVRVPKPKVAPELRRGSVISHENELGTLVLGHSSMITSMKIAEDDKYIITADRDEHIRVSRYPEGYNIETFCLGHTKYVSTLCVLPFSGSTLVSAGGDAELHIWSWKTGALIAKIPIIDHVKPYIVVSSKKLRKEAHERAIANLKKKGPKKPPTQNSAKDTPYIVDDATLEPPGPAPMEVEEESQPPADAPVAAEDTAEEDAFVVSKLEYLSTTSGLSVLMWSNVGATALFYIKDVDENIDSSYTIHAVDVGVPIIDFAHQSRLEGFIYVTCDPNHDPARSQGASYRHVRLLQWNDSVREFTEVVNGEGRPGTLLKLLNQICVPATAESIAALELYDSLVSLPKRTDDQEWDPMHGPAPGDVDLDKPRPSPRPGDKRRNTGERAEKRKTLKRALRDGKFTALGGSEAEHDTVIKDESGHVNTVSETKSTLD